MTLCISISNQWGAWLCSDRRLCDENFEPICDDARKHTTVRCVDGFAVLSIVGFSSIETQHGIFDIARWVAHITREPMLLADMLEHLAAKATEQLSPILQRTFAREPQQFVGVAIVQGEPFTFAVQNVPLGSVEPGEQFHHYAWSEPDGLLARSGSWQAVCPEDREALAALARRRPESAEDNVKRMAQVIARASRHSRFISPNCVVTHLPASGPLRPAIFEIGVERQSRECTAVVV